MRKIVWEAWQDPLNGNLDKFSNFEDDGIAYNKFPGEIDIEDCDENTIFALKNDKIMSTPHGLLSMTENTLAANRFEFWLIHTNFDIRRDFVEKIEKIHGVETIDVFTRYRMRIGFPISGLFNISDIKYNVGQLVKNLNDEDINKNLRVIGAEYGDTILKNIKDIYNQVANSCQYWTIYLSPNGKVEVVKSNDNYQEYCQMAAVVKDVKQMVGGHLLSSEDI